MANSNNNSIENNISGLSITDNNTNQLQDVTSTNSLTSRTPPPPGFDTNSIGNSIKRPNSASYNNLAMALGSGLAECMDDSTGGPAAVHNMDNNNIGGQQQQQAQQGNNNKDPNRIHTPDTYTRQSRHNVSRLSGHQHHQGGFDYLNPTASGLIPPVNSTYLNKLKEQQQQVQQHVGGGGNQLSGGSSAGGVGLTQHQNGGSNPLFATHQSNAQQGGNNTNGNISSLQQAASGMQQSQQHQHQQQPVRFTAAMMAAQSSSSGLNDSSSFQLMSNNNTTNNAQSSGVSNNNANRSSNNQQLQLNQDQELLRQQFINQSSLTSSSNNATTNAIGLTVVEPSSTSNSPAPQRLMGASSSASKGTVGGGHTAQIIGMNGAGLLYPLMQHANNQQQQQQQHGKNQGSGMSGGGQVTQPTTALAPGTVINIASGGRASAPPPQSQPPNGASTGQFIPGGMTTMVLNNAAIRAYTASSLQMRVAELHQEFGGGNSGGGVNAVNNSQLQQQGGGQQQQNQVVSVTTAPPPPGTTVIRTMPPGAIPVVYSPAHTPPLIQRPPSTQGGGGGGGVHNPQASSRGSTPNPVNIIVNSAPQTVIVDVEQQKKENDAVNELSPFLRDDKSKSSTNSTSSSSSSKNNGTNNSSVSTRGLAILYASSLHVPDVRSTCEAFGALESFRSDFGLSLGVYLVTFYDLRSAQLAVNELPKVLNNKGGGGGGNIKQDGNGNSSNNSGGRVQVKYCVPLNSSNTTDESLLMISKLPSSIDEQDLSHVLSSFGEVRAIHYQANMSSSSGADDDDDDELSSYLVEFYDVQDARQALLELEQTNPWGDNVTVKVGTRSPTKRKLGKDMIMLMSRWRQGVVNKDGQSTTTTSSSQKSQQQQQSNQQQTGSSSLGNTASPTPSPSPLEVLQNHQHLNNNQLQQNETTVTTSHDNQQQHDQMQQQQQQQMDSMGSSNQSSSYYQYPNQNPPGQHLQQQQYQLVVGPDGQYQYVVMNSAHHMNHPQMIGHHYGHHPTGQVIIDPHTGQQHIMYSQPTHVDHQLNYMHHHINPQQQYHIQYGGGTAAAAGAQLGHGTLQVDVPSQQQQQSIPPTPFIRLPSDNYSNSVSSGSQLSPGGSRVKSSSAHSHTRKSTASIGSGSSGNNSGGGADEEDHNNLTLSIENVKSGKERRTSLMVRNIPNKYTQQMLLSEFSAAGHGSDKMDFFYLPIDFKNKCNRGYAFVNFVDYKDIIPFVEKYNGCGWTRFNSDKICDITYARIQGKAAMLKRFENSSLMEKDDEYRPKVFVSHGERKGQVESIPRSSSGY